MCHSATVPRECSVATLPLKPSSHSVVLSVDSLVRPEEGTSRKRRLKVTTEIPVLPDAKVLAAEVHRRLRPVK